jgi:DnaB-like helicase C terminal domain
MLLTRDEIQQRIAERQQTPRYKFVRPLGQHAEDLISSLQIEGGIGLGLGDVDVLTRGFRPTDLVVISAFAHGGKTQLALTLVASNPNKRVLYFSLDDPAPMLLAKLIAMRSGIPSERIESRVRAGDEAIKRLVTETASIDLPNFTIVDESLSISDMRHACEEAAEMWGQPPDCVIVDYVEMISGEHNADDQAFAVKKKMNTLKAWAKIATYPIIALHQGTRSNARPGAPITLLSLGYSGEAQGTIVIGCRRKRDNPDLSVWDRRQHEDTITVHCVKNKRPGGRLTHYEGIDFYLNPETGLIRPLSSAAQVAEQQRMREWDDL